jgi:hypothetical protein
MENNRKNAQLILSKYSGLNEETAQGISIINAMIEFAKRCNPIPFDLLYRYSIFLEEQGYMDIGWRAEEPYAIDEFINTLKK